MSNRLSSWTSQEDIEILVSIADRARRRQFAVDDACEVIQVLVTQVMNDQDNLLDLLNLLHGYLERSRGAE